MVLSKYRRRILQLSCSEDLSRMCLKMSKIPALPAAYIWIYLVVLMRDATTDNSLSSLRSQKKPSNQQPYTWKGWNDWAPSPYDSRHYQDTKRQKQHPYIPLSLSEQAKLQHSKDLRELPSSKVSQDSTNKTGNANNQKGKIATLGELQGLKETAINFGTMVLDHFARSLNTKYSTEEDVPLIRQPRTAYLENLGNRQDGPNVGKPEPEARRGVIDWLARLIGVQGKTLGEFLREYQVHVLYDLAFTFFKWIFFLYAGLLIP